MKLPSINKIAYTALAVAVLWVLSPNYVTAQETSKDGISFYDKNSGLEKRLFMPGEDVRAKITLPAGNEGKEITVYGINPQGKTVMDTTFTYNSPTTLDLKESTTGEYTVLANIEGNNEVLRNSAGIGEKVKFDEWEKADVEKGKPYVGFAKSAIDVNEDGYLSKKEVYGYDNFDIMASSEKFNKEDNKLIVYNFKKEKRMSNPKIRITGKGNQELAEFIKNMHYGIVDISKTQSKSFVVFVNGLRGASGIRKK